MSYSMQRFFEDFSSEDSDIAPYVGNPYPVSQTSLNDQEDNDRMGDLPPPYASREHSEDDTDTLINYLDTVIHMCRMETNIVERTLRYEITKTRELLLFGLVYFSSMILGVCFLIYWLAISRGVENSSGSWFSLASIRDLLTILHHCAYILTVRF